MTPHDSSHLLHGPYSAPACKVGDRLHCESRGWVVIAGFHDGPIPWPLTEARGGLCFILCGDLARAVRCEKLVAVARGWGVSITTAWRWRKNLVSEGPTPEARTGASPHAPGRRSRRWTDTEDALVQTLAPVEAARQTGRTLKAVYARRMALGVAGRRTG
jgi:hypothetical protein